MATLLDLKTKINSTQNTGQITKALELVSAARQKKALDFLNNSRSLRTGMRQIMGQVMKDSNILLTSSDHSSLPKLFQEKNTGKVLIVTVMSQRGLCGAINTNLFYEIVKFKKQFTDKTVDFISVNKIAQKYLKNFGEKIIAYYSDIRENPDLGDILPLIEYIKGSFGEYEKIYLAYTNFVKTGVFAPKFTQILPISNDDIASAEETSKTLYSIEPDPYTLLDDLSNLYVDLEVYESILSGQTSEHSARMIAMKKATDNVKTVVKDLTLKYNKERQAKITQAMAEISTNI